MTILVFVGALLAAMALGIPAKPLQQTPCQARARAKQKGNARLLKGSAQRKTA